MFLECSVTNKRKNLGETLQEVSRDRKCSVTGLEQSTELPMTLPESIDELE